MALGAHALKETLTLHSSVTTWQTAMVYQLVHSAALLAIAQLPAARSTTVAWTARCWTAGVILFSGSLYWLSVGGPKIIGPITPLGGLAFLVGWALLVWDSVQAPKA